MPISVECAKCRGTGVYRGFAEPEGVGVVCLECGGSGCKEIAYTPFSKRKTRNDVREVKRSRGTMIPLGVGPVGESIPYSAFLEGKMPS